MKTRFRVDHHTINIFLVLLSLLFFETAVYCESENKMNEMNTGFISLISEQKFWKNWISINDDTTCPLSPFILSYTQAEIENFENKSRALRKTDFAMLFIQVNIDNGIFYISYFTWNEFDKYINSLEWHGPNSAIVENKLNKEQFGIIFSLDKISNHNILVDIKDRKTLDADSIYLSLWHKGRYSRFAFYNPKLVKNTIKIKNQMPFKFLEELLKNFDSVGR